MKRYYWTVVVEWPDGDRKTYQFFASSIFDAIRECRKEFGSAGLTFISVSRLQS